MTGRGLGEVTCQSMSEGFFLLPGNGREMHPKAWRLYLRDIRRTRVLDREEEGRLLLLASGGNVAARDALIVSNLRFVLRMAMRYRNPGLPLPDLVNEGCLGLIRAVESFEVGRGVRFLSYAVWWIRASMTRALDRSGALIRIPGRFAARTKDERFQDGTTGPGEGVRIMARLVPFEEGNRFVSSRDLRDEEDQPGEEQRAWADGMPARLGFGGTAVDAPSPVSTELLARLPEREAQVLRSLYSLDHRPSQSLREVASSLGMSHQRVRQLRDQAFNRLRSHARRFYGGWL